MQKSEFVFYIICMRKLIHFFIFMILLPPFVFYGCGGGGGTGAFMAQEAFYQAPAEFELVFPDNVPSFVTDYKLVWLDENYCVQQKTLPVGTQTETARFALNRTTPILLYPLINGTQFFIPAGAVYPFGNIESNRINLSQEAGYAAEILQTILSVVSPQNIEQKEYFCSYFNWDHFVESLEKHKPLYLLDEEKIITGICSGTMKATNIKKVKTFSISSSQVPTNIEWLYSPEIAEGNLLTKDKFEISQTGSMFYSNLGIIKIEKQSSSSNSLVITELAR